MPRASWDGHWCCERPLLGGPGLPPTLGPPLPLDRRPLWLPTWLAQDAELPGLAFETSGCWGTGSDG